MIAPKGFKSYTSKPVKRFAYEINSKDHIHALSETDYIITVEGEEISFKAHETIFPGDFIVFLDEDDVYHCRQGVFRERNIVH